MFTRQIHNADPSKATKQLDPAALKYRLGDYGYGKHEVNVFQLKKDGPVHHITEYKVSANLRLRTHKEYYEANNSDIIGSDVAETSMYIHAKKYGLRTPEEFALSLTQHLLDEFELIMEVNVIVKEMAWQRFGEQEQQGYYQGKSHNHAFMRNMNGMRFCEVVRRREEPESPLLLGGLQGLRVMKTAKAPFTGYVKGSLFTEGDSTERILCADINAKWQYAKIKGIDFKQHWHQVRDIILQAFGGDPVEGVITTSVQYAAYMAERAVLDAMPELSSVSIQLPKYDYIPFDFSRFPAFETNVDVVISAPHQGRHAIGYARLDRTEN